jgi:hypothetical protein
VSSLNDLAHAWGSELPVEKGTVREPNKQIRGAKRSNRERKKKDWNNYVKEEDKDLKERNMDNNKTR